MNIRRVLTIKLVFVFCFSLLNVKGSLAQKVKLSQFANWKPRNIGPAGMSGRITAIDAVADDPRIVYLGSASGGVWKTTNAGASWTPVFDETLVKVSTSRLMAERPGS